MPILHDNASSDFTLDILVDTDPPELLVCAWEAVESISKPFHLLLQLASHQRDVDLGGMLGKQARLKINGLKEDRYIHGIISRFTQNDSSPEFARYEMEVVPAFWFLGQHEEFRIFQEMTTEEVVTQVLDEFGIKGEPWVKWSLSAELPVRKYCVCYGESLLDFVQRLLAEEGIFYYFEHLDQSHRLVFGDEPGIHAEIIGGPELAFRSDRSRTNDEEYILGFDYDVRVRPQKTMLRDFHFIKPLDELEGECIEEGELVVDGHPAAAKILVYDYPGRFTEADAAERVAKIRHGQNRANTRAAHGLSNCRRLQPGYSFTLTEHERESFLIGYIVTEVRHRGSQPAVTASEAAPTDEPLYEVGFRCIPAEDTWHWEELPPQPRVIGVQTALVVGPKGEEIYTDDDGYGQVKVQFHWDRRGEFNEKSSCWLRIAQPTGGPGMGQFALPRVGHEVVVSFLNGDPDRPLITGVLYNAENMPPLKLPEEKSRSTIKTLSTPDGEGFNELRFEDKKGEEQIFMQAQFDFDLRILNDSRESVVNDRHLTVENNSLQNVWNDQSSTVGRHRMIEIAKDDHLKISGKQAIEISDSYSLSVGDDVIELFAADHSEECAGAVFIKGNEVVVEGSSSLTLKCGSSEVVIDSGGVTIKGSSVTIDSSSVGIAGGAGTSGGSGSAGNVVAPLAPFVPALAAESGVGMLAKVKEQTFKEPDPEEIEAEKLVWIEIELVGEDDVGIPGEPYLIKTPDGKIVRGSTGPDGTAKVIGLQPGTCQVSFPNLDEEAWEKI